MNVRHMYAAMVLLIVSMLAGCSFAGDRQEIPSPVTQYPPLPSSGMASPLSGQTITIVTGDLSGVYFPLGQTLADIYERNGGAVTGTRMTKASLENVQLVAQKKAELGFSSVDALLRTEDSSGLRVITGLYFNYVHIVVAKKSGIHSLQDLAGKRVSIGPIGSGTTLSAERILQAAHLTDSTMEKYHFSFSQASQALRDGVIDAAFFSSGLPNPDVSSLVDGVSFTLIPVPDDVMAALHKAYPYYLKKEIPANTYSGLAKTTETMTVKNVLVTYRELPVETAYALAQQLYEHLPELSNTHPAALGINAEEADSGTYLPLHPGAARYFTERKQNMRPD